MRQKEQCLRCGRMARLSEHHVFPKRIFGEGGKKIPICRKCHTTLEQAIQQMEFKILHQYAGAYVNIVKRFVHA